jgi:hypothetical protein
MVVLGVDAHKHSHTVVAVDELGRKLGERTLGTRTADHRPGAAGNHRLRHLDRCQDCR